MRGDFDEDELDDDSEWFDDPDDVEPIACPCGRVSCREACEQCGTPLCPMCFETGGGFCSKHPDESYRPDEPEAAEPR